MKYTWSHENDFTARGYTNKPIGRTQVVAAYYAAFVASAPVRVQPQRSSHLTTGGPHNILDQVSSDRPT